MSSVTISLTRIRVNRHGYDARGSYYGAGQNGHAWRVTFDHFASAGIYSGFVRGRDGRKTRSLALKEARASLCRHHLDRLPQTVE